MLMHVNARKMAFGGLMLALCVLFMALGSVFESSTLFLLACASFFEGIVIREMGMKTGLAFYLAAVILGFLLAPNKFYVISFAGMALYILAVEGVWRLLARRPGRWQGRGVFWCFKYLIFNAMYIRLCCCFRRSSSPGGFRRSCWLACSWRGRRPCGSTTTPTSMCRRGSGRGSGGGCSGCDGRVPERSIKILHLQILFPVKESTVRWRIFL